MAAVKSLTQVFTDNSRNSAERDQVQGPHSAEDSLYSHKYKSPTEFAIEELSQDITELEVRLESATSLYEECKQKYQNPDIKFELNKQQYSNCQLRLDHSKRHSETDTCTSSEQCGDALKHEDECKLINGVNEVKTLEKDLKLKQNELVQGP